MTPPRRPRPPTATDAPDPRDPRGEGMFGGGVDPRTGVIGRMPGYTMPVSHGIRPWPHGAPHTLGTTVAPAGTHPATHGLGATVVPAGVTRGTLGGAHNSGEYPGLNPSTAPASNLGLVPEAAQEYTRYQVAMQEALAGEADPAKRAAYARVYQDFLNSYAAYARQSTTQMNAAIAEQMRTQGRVDPMAMQRYAQQMNQTFLAQYNSGLEQRHGAVGREAWSRLHSHMSGPSVFAAVRDNVYNPEDAREGGSAWSGIRLGGIAGGAIGLLAGLKLFGEYGILGYIAAGVMTIGFSYGGNMLQRHFIDRPRGTPDTPRTTPELRMDGRDGPTPGTPTLDMEPTLQPSVPPSDAPVPPQPAAPQMPASARGSLPAGITVAQVSNNFQPVAPATPAAAPSQEGRQQPGGYTPS